MWVEVNKLTGRCKQLRCIHISCSRKNRHHVVPKVGETATKVAVAAHGTAEKVQLFTRA